MSIDTILAITKVVIRVLLLTIIFTAARWAYSPKTRKTGVQNPQPPDRESGETRKS